MKTLLEVCKEVYEIRRQTWARQYDFTDVQILELYGPVVATTAKVLGIVITPVVAVPKPKPVIEATTDDDLEELW